MHRVISQEYFLQYKADIFNFTWKRIILAAVRIMNVFPKLIHWLRVLGIIVKGE